MDMLVFTLLGAAIFGAALFPGDGDEAEDTSTPDDGPGTESDDTLTIATGTTGTASGLAGNDTITVTAQTGAEMDVDDNMFPEWSTDDGIAPLTVDGGAGDDTLVLSGGGYVATGGDGADRIEMGDAHDVWVRAGEGDTVIGGTGRSVAELDGNAVFMGSAGSDFIIADTAGTVDLGAGNDQSVGGETATHVIAGDGSDYLQGTRGTASATGSLLATQTSLDADTLDGGAGDDMILASHGDQVILGSGADTLKVHLEQQASTSAVQIADYDPEEDEQIHIYYGSFEQGDDAPLPLVGDISVTETAGNTIISGSNGQTLAVLTGVTGLTVGLQLSDSDSEPVTDLAGSALQGGATSADILIYRFAEVIATP